MNGGLPSARYENRMTENKILDMLSPGTVEQIERGGFTVIPSVVEGAEIDRLLTAVASLAEAQSTKSASETYALRNLLVCPMIRAFADSPAIRQIVAPLLGSGAFAVRGIFFDKTPERNWKVNWHQDLAIAVRERRESAGFGAWSVKAGVVHVQPPPELLARMITVRVHLDDCPPQNGALRVLAGSHRVGRLRDAEIAAWQERTAETLCAVPRGGAIVMRPLLLHASSASEIPARRRVIHLEYAAEALPDGLQWHIHAGAP